MKKSSKGNYYRLRTKKWLEENGYLVENLERTYRIYDEKKNRVVFVKRDIWGADLIARNSEELIFIQVKSNKSDIAKGIRELSKGPWPAKINRAIMIWPQRGQFKNGPDIIEVPCAVS